MNLFKWLDIFSFLTYSFILLILKTLTSLNIFFTLNWLFCWQTSMVGSKRDQLILKKLNWGKRIKINWNILSLIKHIDLCFHLMKWLKKLLLWLFNFTIFLSLFTKIVLFTNLLKRLMNMLNIIPFIEGLVVKGTRNLNLLITLLILNIFSIVRVIFGIWALLIWTHFTLDFVNNRTRCLFSLRNWDLIL
jgi:hypothetical protein